MDDRSPNRWKTLREKEKLLITSNFSFSHSVFKRLILQTRKNQGLFGKGLISIVHKMLSFVELGEGTMSKVRAMLEQLSGKGSQMFKM